MTLQRFSSWPFVDKKGVLRSPSWTDQNMILQRFSSWSFAALRGQKRCSPPPVVDRQNYDFANLSSDKRQRTLKDALGQPRTSICVQRCSASEPPNPVSHVPLWRPARRRVRTARPFRDTPDAINGFDAARVPVVYIAYTNRRGSVSYALIRPGSFGCRLSCVCQVRLPICCPYDVVLGSRSTGVRP